MCQWVSHFSNLCALGHPLTPEKRAKLPKITCKIERTGQKHSAPVSRAQICLKDICSVHCPWTHHATIPARTAPPPPRQAMAPSAAEHQICNGGVPTNQQVEATPGLFQGKRSTITSYTATNMYLLKQLQSFSKTQHKPINSPHQIQHIGNLSKPQIGIPSVIFTFGCTDVENAKMAWEILRSGNASASNCKFLLVHWINLKTTPSYSPTLKVSNFELPAQFSP